jgi:hypothetical protein
MFVKIFVKEWRENILIFALALLMMAIMIVLNLTGREEMTLYSSGMFLLLFLPLAAMLIGSGGFYTEYKDNAWVYLFSRPIKKEYLWIFKYFSQLSVLVAVFVVFYFVRRLLPGLDKIFQDLDINYPAFNFGEHFSLSVYVVFSVIAFTIAFSLSFLHDKQFVIFLLSILINTGVLCISQIYIYFLWELGFFTSSEGLLSILIALSFVLASILTLVKADFSQTKKKILRFSAYALIFLVLSFFLSTAWATKGQIFSSKRELSAWFAQAYQGSLYFQDYRQGVLRYDPSREGIERLNKNSRFSPEPFSLKAGQIAYMQIRSRRQWTNDLWLMNTDGSGARPLVQSSEEDSPFYRKRVESFILSHDAQKIAFVTTQKEERENKKSAWIHTLWWMNTDGSRLKSQILDVPYGREARLIALMPFADKVVLEIKQRAIVREKSRIKMIDLVEGTVQVLAENSLSPLFWNPSPDQDYLTLTIRNPDTEKDMCILLNLRTFETTELYSKEVLGLASGRWSPDGRKIVFFQPREQSSHDRELWFYDLEEKKFEKFFQQEHQHGIRYDWASNGQKFLILDSIEEESLLIVMNEDFEKEKTIKIPKEVPYAYHIWGLENCALLQTTGKGVIWRVDLETEDWKRIY